MTILELIKLANDVNAAEIEQTFKNVRNLDGVCFGNWKVKLTRLDENGESVEIDE